MLQRALALVSVGSDSRLLATAAAFDTCQVAARLHLGEAALHQQSAHCLSLVVTMFQQQLAAGLEVHRRGADDLTNVIQTIGTTVSACVGSWHSAARCGSWSAM